MAVNFENWIGERMAQHQRAEEARNAPAAVARRAVYELRSALADLTVLDRRAALRVLAEEILVPRHEELRIVSEQSMWDLLARAEREG